uniref:Uncharacterized protein n=1 Tax=Trichinella nativa TaxID=6335 RepID=A0A0V1KHZ2_9BILA
MKGGGDGPFDKSAALTAWRPKDEPQKKEMIAQRLEYSMFLKRTWGLVPSTYMAAHKPP